MHTIRTNEREDNDTDERKHQMFPEERPPQVLFQRDGLEYHRLECPEESRAEHEEDGIPAECEPIFSIYLKGNDRCTENNGRHGDKLHLREHFAENEVAECVSEYRHQLIKHDRDRRFFVLEGEKVAPQHQHVQDAYQHEQEDARSAHVEYGRIGEEEER